MTIAADVHFVPFSEVSDTGALGTRLSEIVVGNKRIAKDFPAVVARYGSAEVATMSVRQNAAGESSNFAAFAVMGGDRVLGAATLVQAKIEGAWPLFGWAPLIVAGPQLACWLEPRGERPEGFQESLAPQILHLLEQQAREREMLGIAWSLVRPKHSHSAAALETTVAFGGFRPMLHPMRYWRVDRSWEKRQLYVAQNPLN